MQNEIISKVWKISGLIGKVTAGILAYKNERVAFITEDGIKFDVRINELYAISYPFLRMGMGFDTIVNGGKFKFSFAKPNASAPEITIVKNEPWPRAMYAGFYIDDVSSLMDIKENKATARLWKEILTQAK